MVKAFAYRVTRTKMLRCNTKGGLRKTSMSELATTLNPDGYRVGHSRPSSTRRDRIGTIVKTLLALLLLTIAASAQLGRIVPMLDPLNALTPVILAVAVIISIFSFRRQRLTFAIATLAACCSVERVAPVTFGTGQAAVSAGPGITVLSFNAWRNQHWPAETARAIAASDADIVLLQEAGPLLNQADKMLRTAYPFQSDCPIGCDLAILSRRPVRDFRYRIRDDNGRFVGPRVVFADIEDASAMGPITVASIHVGRGTSFVGNQRQLDKSLDEMFTLIDKENLIIGGDFNMTPYSFAIAQTDEAMFPIRRVSAGDRSYPSQIAGLPTIPLFAIDHIYASPRWQAAKISVGHGFHSDHRPIAVRLFESGPNPSH